MIFSSSSYGAYVLTLLSVALSFLLLSFLHHFFFRPASLRRALLQQGLTVLPYRPVFGSLPYLARLDAAARSSDMPSASDHDLAPRILPLYHNVFSKLSVDTFVYWTGTVPTVVVGNPDYVKSVMSADYRSTVKPDSAHHSFQKLLGSNGLLLTSGQDWYNQRNILRPAFFTEKLKHMVAEMASSAMEMVRSWETKVIKHGGHSAEVEIAHDLKNTAADILTRTSFGSSYKQGKSVFEKQVKLLDILEGLRVLNSAIPGYRFLPTAANLQCMKLEKRINKELTEIVESRRKSIAEGEAISHKTDLLGLMLAAETDEPKSKASRLTTQQVIDDCKTFFFAGHETTANLLAWTMMLLSLSQDWQERAREEVLEICGKEAEPTADELNKLKILGNILNESLRLYPPVPEYGRRLIVSKDKHFELDQISLPPGTIFTVPALLIHRNKDLWGKDADEFRPERFDDGVSKACKHPYGFQPFGMGPRICIGQTFAIMEAKVIMACILQRFKFELSANYRHAPERAITMRPKYGMPLILHLTQVF